MGLVRCHQDLLPGCDRLRRLTTMNGCRREQSDPSVMMLMVVPLKERTRPGASIGQTAELGWKARPIFQRLELTFRIRIVVGDVRPRMGLGYTQVGQQLRHAFGRHRTAPIGMQRELIGGNPFFGATL